MFGDSDARAAGGWGRAVPVLGFAAAILLFLFERTLWPGAEPTGASVDLRLYFFPLYEATSAWIVGGRLPLWNPYHLTGVPWLATLQGGYAYPLHAIYLAVPTGIGLAVSHFVHLLLIAVGTYAFARRAGLLAPAAALAAILFTLCGTLQSWLFWPNMLEAVSWLPLGCWAVLGVARGEGARPVCWLALAIGMTLLAGHTQVTGFALYLWGALFLVAMLRARGGRSAALFAFAGALLLGALIGAVQTLPSFELSQEGTRRAGAMRALHARSVGDVAIRSLSMFVYGSRFSLGGVALLLVPAALLGARHRWLALSALVVGSAAFALAFASHTGLLPVYLALPGIGWFRQPHRLYVLVNFAVVVLAAVGADALLRRLGAARARVVAAGLLIVALAEGLLVTGLREPLPYGAAFAARYRESEAIDRALAPIVAENRATRLLSRRDPETKLAAVRGVRWLDDYEPLNLRRHAEYFTFLREGHARHDAESVFFAGAVIPDPRTSGTELIGWLRGVASRRRLLDLAATRFVTVSSDVRANRRRAVEAFVAAADLAEHPFASDRIVLYENPHALPRAFVSYRARPAPDTETLLAALARPNFDPLELIYVEGDTTVGDDRAAPRGVAATLARDEATVVEIDVDLVADGLVVLADAFSPGWRATVDGEPAPILAANHLFRAVPASAGRHRVRFSYRPWSVIAGAALSLLGLVLLAALARRGRGPRESASESP